MDVSARVSRCNVSGVIMGEFKNGKVEAAEVGVKRKIAMLKRNPAAPAAVKRT